MECEESGKQGMAVGAGRREWALQGSAIHSCCCVELNHLFRGSSSLGSCGFHFSESCRQQHNTHAPQGARSALTSHWNTRPSSLPFCDLTLHETTSAAARINSHHESLPDLGYGCEKACYGSRGQLLIETGDLSHLASIFILLAKMKSSSVCDPRGGLHALGSSS